ncbi:MAG: hypothetical protein BAA01_04060 [Bacillus thermozeamaize]|uniref:Crp/Fnr family transcriptional regulator n=1 Tax=Bacillus thermozeamaize TaxID=230954 RepID=A0A1Y3PHG5_9BACI|nr:MAG: hypothetical protein BAA01_04060 [Bacillus thermozeamaize]
MFHLFRKIPLFRDIEPDAFERLHLRFDQRNYPKHGTIFREGQEREAIFFILKGIVKTYKVDETGKEQLISLLHQGEMFPHVGLFDDVPYPATAEAIQETELLVIPISDFRNLLASHPRMAAQVIAHMEQKIMDLQQRLQKMMSADVLHRLIDILLHLADEYGVVQNGHTVIHIPLTNQDLANMLGTSRETVSRMLNHLKKEQLLDTGRQQIILYDPEKLKLKRNHY